MDDGKCEVAKMQVHGCLDSLHTHLKMVDEKIAELQDRLAPVLSDPPPTNKKEEKPNTPLCQIASRIEDGVVVCQRHFSELVTLIGRLEV
jgi:hypothetical protein